MVILHRQPMSGTKHKKYERLVIDPFQVVAVAEQLQLETGEGAGSIVFMRGDSTFLVTEPFDEVMRLLHEPGYGISCPEDI